MQELGKVLPKLARRITTTQVNTTEQEKAPSPSSSEKFNVVNYILFTPARILIAFCRRHGIVEFLVLAVSSLRLQKVLARSWRNCAPKISNPTQTLQQIVLCMLPLQQPMRILISVTLIITTRIPSTATIPALPAAPPRRRLKDESSSR